VPIAGLPHVMTAGQAQLQEPRSIGTQLSVTSSFGEKPFAAWQRMVFMA
jgi:hypothetical protein